jgi:hypothetical protein
MMMDNQWRITNGGRTCTTTTERAPQEDVRGLHALSAIRHSLLLLPLLAVISPLPAAAEAAELNVPHAQEQEEQEKLSERLIRQATGQEDRGLMGRIMELMSQAAGRLKREFDPGQNTRRVQQEIIEKLDEAITAAQRRRSKAFGQQQQVSDKRRAQPRSDDSEEDASEDDEDMPSETSATPGQAQTGRTAVTGRLREFRRGWGNLPQRDRDEILQGIDEEILEKYRPLIEDYFRALAEDQEE